MTTVKGFWVHDFQKLIQEFERFLCVHVSLCDCTVALVLNTVRTLCAVFTVTAADAARAARCRLLYIINCSVFFIVHTK